MPKKYTTEEAIHLKKKGIKRINALLEYLISLPLPQGDSDPDYTKKAALISKWIEQYANYISFESKFDPSKNIHYKRGDIVFVNFGFGIGSEFGGNHYAVVLDKNNYRNASSVTVIPLSSHKENKELYERDVFLGNELYEKLNLKLQTTIISLREQLDNAQTMLQLLLEKENAENIVPDEIIKLKQTLTSNKQKLNKDIEDAEKVKKELSSLKEGSVAKIEQIRTISKIRIYNPRGKRDPLYNIRFSEGSMQKINQKLKELYLFDE